VTKLGYKIVSDSGNKTYAWSLYGGEKFKISLKVGEVTEVKNGLYLGTSKDFVTDYYSGLSDSPDLLLTYEYNSDDVMSGDPESKSGEVKVRKASLKHIERLEESVTKSKKLIHLIESLSECSDGDCGVCSKCCGEDNSQHVLHGAQMDEPPYVPNDQCTSGQVSNDGVKVRDIQDLINIRYTGKGY
jgi:hypothetical protein